MSQKPPIYQEVVTRLMPVFFKSLNTIYSSSAKLTDEINFDYTDTEEEFKKGTILLHMATI